MSAVAWKTERGVEPKKPGTCLWKEPMERERCSQTSNNRYRVSVAGLTQLLRWLIFRSSFPFPPPFLPLSTHSCLSLSPSLSSFYSSHTSNIQGAHSSITNSSLVVIVRGSVQSRRGKRIRRRVYFIISLSCYLISNQWQRRRTEQPVTLHPSPAAVQV